MSRVRTKLNKERAPEMGKYLGRKSLQPSVLMNTEVLVFSHWGTFNES